jgi:hypothetical protein
MNSLADAGDIHAQILPALKPRSPAVPGGLVAGLAALALAAGTGWPTAAHAGSLEVRDDDGSRWEAIENPDDDADDYVLKRVDPQHKPDPKFGKMGLAEFSLGPDNDAPSSVRVVAATRSVWVAGATLSGNRPQAVVYRFNADGSTDSRWGVLGKMQVAPSGMAIRAHDVLPLSDGSVLVAGEAPSGTDIRAVVFHMKPDGAVDLQFGSGGIWMRPGGEQAVATALSVADNGAVAVSVVTRGPKPAGEIWSLDKGSPVKLSTEVFNEGPDEEDTRAEWIAGRWNWNMNGGPTRMVPAATLDPKPLPVLTAPVAQTSSDPGNVAYNPFVESRRDAAPVKAHDDDGGVPWIWIAIAGALALGLTALFFKRGGGTTDGRAPTGRPRQNARR